MKIVWLSVFCVVGITQIIGCSNKPALLKRPSAIPALRHVGLGIDERVDVLVRNIAGIVALDKLESSQAFAVPYTLARGTAYEASVDLLQEWLTSPIKNVLQCDRLLVEHGKQIEHDLAPIRDWCRALV
jgi:hypothetical protein